MSMVRVSMDRPLGAFCLCLAVGYGYLITRLPQQRIPDDVGEGFFPWMLMGAIALLSLALLIHPAKSRDASEIAEEDNEQADQSSIARGILTLALLVGYVLALPEAGFLASSTAFSVILMRLSGSTSWVRNVLIAAVATLAIQLTFTEVFLVPLPSGPLLEWLRD